MENQKFFFSFFNMGTGWKKFAPSFFKLGVNPTKSYGENTKSPSQDFIDFAIKPIIKKWFFSQIYHKYLLFLYIIVWFSYIFMICN